MTAAVPEPTLEGKIAERERPVYDQALAQAYMERRDR